jgi:nicotinamidase-related amidase
MSLQEARLLGAKAVHLCVDMQRLFAPGGPWPTPWMERTLPQITRIAARSPQRTIFTRFIPPRDPGDLPGVWQRYYRRWRHVTLRHLDPRLLDLVPALAAMAPPARVVDRPVYSPWQASPLLHLVGGLMADTLVVTGAESDVCVLATVMGAIDHGFRVVVVTDAICSSSDAGHDAMLTLYRERYSEQVAIAVTEEVLEAWSPAVGEPA